MDCWIFVRATGWKKKKKRISLFNTWKLWIFLRAFEAFLLSNSVSNSQWYFQIILFFFFFFSDAPLYGDFQSDKLHDLGQLLCIFYVTSLLAENRSVFFFCVCISVYFISSDAKISRFLYIKSSYLFTLLSLSTFFFLSLPIFTSWPSNNSTIKIYLKYQPFVSSSIYK